MAFRGELIRAWREVQGLSQSAAASRVHLSQVFWQKLEAGEKQPLTVSIHAPTWSATFESKKSKVPLVLLILLSIGYA